MKTISDLNRAVDNANILLSDMLESFKNGNNSENFLISLNQLNFAISDVCDILQECFDCILDYIEE